MSEYHYYEFHASGSSAFECLDKDTASSFPSRRRHVKWWPRRPRTVDQRL